jgi:hypothetical protein
MKRVVLLLIPLALSLGAQVRFDAPTLGYVHDPEAKAIRQLGGVAGAASFEATVDAGVTVERAWISRLGFALVQTKQEAGEAKLLDWKRGSSLNVGDLQEAAISHSGRFFALLRGTNSTSVEIWDGLAASRMWTLESVPAGARNLAVSDDGGAVLLASSTAVWFAEQGQRGVRSIWSGESILLGGFLGSSREYAVLDAANSKYLTSRTGSMVESDAPISGVTAFTTTGESSLVFGGVRAIALLDLNAGTTRVLPTELAVESFGQTLQAGDAVQVRFKNDTRTALFERAGESAQIEFLAPAGGIR